MHMQLLYMHMHMSQELIIRTANIFTRCTVELSSLIKTDHDIVK